MNFFVYCMLLYLCLICFLDSCVVFWTEHNCMISFSIHKFSLVSFNIFLFVRGIFMKNINAYILKDLSSSYYSIIQFQLELIQETCIIKIFVFSSSYNFRMTIRYIHFKDCATNLWKSDRPVSIVGCSGTISRN